MFDVYVLYSPQYDKIYIGYTSDLQARFLSHNELATKGYTMRYRPWEILYTESFHTKQESMKRERQLKSHQGRNFIRELIKRNYGKLI
ncbi:GIY-YIG nuclease family protein [Marinifilum caeruleilacunae]|uniref:GIY-YIG nuclease family protein n=1 Tax=Marinifilum caeruleilacunae TaxID=2499076 RepID=A0ABX1WY82_9BACT|nr:GIY-YIG nuclease family protein [Marinifilum caeruleilacunae]